jgi:hypothetical protein
MRAIYERATELAGIDEEHVAPAVAELAVLLRSRARNHRHTGICVE